MLVTDGNQGLTCKRSYVCSQIARIRQAVGPFRLPPWRQRMVARTLEVCHPKGPKWLGVWRCPNGFFIFRCGNSVGFLTDERYQKLLSCSLIKTDPWSFENGRRIVLNKRLFHDDLRIGGLLSPRKPQRIWIELGTKRDKWIPIETPHGDPCSVFAAIEKVVSRITCLTGQQNSFRQGNQPNCQMPLWEGLILYCFLAKEVENSDLLNLDSSNHTPQTQLWMTAAPSFCFFCFRSRQVVFHQIPKDTGTALDPWHHFFRQQNKQTHDLGTPQNKSP